MDGERNYLGQAVIRAAVGPARAAYLVRAGSRDGFRRAVQEASTRWGGMAEPIIPVRKKGRVEGLWRQVVELADLDGLVNVDVDLDDAKTAAAGLQLDVTPLQHIDRFGPTRWTTHPANLAGGDWREGARFPTCARRDGDLWEVAAAGDLTSEAEEDLSGSNMPPVRPATTDLIARAQLSGATLLDLGIASFGERWARNGPSPTPMIVWVTAPNSLVDVLAFWNLRALRPLRFETAQMLLLPHRGTEAWIGLDDELHQLLVRPAEVSPDVVITSWGARQHLDAVAATLGLVVTTEEPRSTRSWPPPPLREPPFTFRADLDPFPFVVFERGYGAQTEVLTQLFRSRTMVEFDSPVPFAGSAALATVRLSGQPLERFPRRDDIATLVERNARWHGDELKLAMPGAPRYRIELALPSAADVVETLLARATAGHALSDKGKLGTGLLAAGSTQHLLEPGVFEAVQILTTPRSKELLRALRAASDSPEADLLAIAAEFGGRANRPYRETTKIVSHESWPTGVLAASALETLAAAGWAERGAEVACDRCGLASFVPMASLGPAGECPGCHYEQGYTVTAAGPTVFYRLDSFVDRCGDQGVLPHLMVIDVLKARHEDAWLLPGVSFRPHDGDEGEVDVVGTIGPKLLAGEIKTSADRLSKTELRKGLRHSRSIGADIHLVAAIDAIPGSVRNEIERLATEAGMEWLVLDRSELRPGA